MYGQKNYSQLLGTGPATIAQCGCLLTSFSNLFNRFGEDINPFDLNNWFLEHGIFMADGSANVRDILGWGSISARDGSIHVTSTGPGWPSSNNAIVKFHFNGIDHFCLVNDVANQTIVDSYDGVTKGPGWYKPYYGEPVAYAVYEKVNPTPPTPTVPENHPAAVAPDYDGNAINIQPGWGISNAAEAAGWPDANTPARWEAIAQLNGSNDWQAFNAGLKVGQRIVVGHYEAPQAPQEPPKPANVVFSLWAGPTEFTTNKDAKKWDLGFGSYAEAKAVADLPAGTPVTVYGKAQRTDLDHPVYLMTKEDFGDADQSGNPVSYTGINIADLSPAPAPAEPAAPVTPEPKPAATDSADGEKIPVTNNWKGTWKAFLSPQAYVANQNVTVKEIDETIPVTDQHPDMVQLVNKQPVPQVAGTFSRNGQLYYRTARSVELGYWYGIADFALTRVSDIQDDNLMDETLQQANAIRKELHLQNGKEKMLETVGAIDGFVSKVLHRKNKE